MILKDLISDLEYKEIIGKIDIEIFGIAYDSRKCDNKFVFCALKGLKSDGHDFIETAINKGSSVIICEILPLILFDYVTYIQVENTRKALARISHNFYNNPTSKMKIIGVTGTNGKTTITYLLKSIFEENGDKVGIIGTTGIMIGDEKIPSTHTTPESLELCGYFDLMQKKSVNIVIMEVSSHSLDQHRVDFIDFDTALFTNLTPDHLDYHHDMQDYASAKKKLFDMLKPEAKAILFNNSEFSKYLIKDCKTEFIKFIGRNDKSDYKIEKENLGLGDSSFKLIINNSEELNIQTILSGMFNIDNAAIAAATALINNLSDDIIIKGLVKTTGAPGRMQQIKLKNGALAIVDYAHTPDALEKALIACREVLNSTDNPGHLICVFGCGGDRDKSKRPVMGRIAQNLADYTVITSDNPRCEDPNQIIMDIMDGLDFMSKYKFFPIINRPAAIKEACRVSEKGDLILVAGKGHEDYQVIGTQKFHFDDVEELMKWNNI